MTDQHVGEFEGVILAAGRGTRMAPFSERYPKPLLPILNKPLIHHQIEYLRDLGVRKIFVVIGHLGYEISHSLGRGEELGVEIVYIEQRNSLGIAHAVMQLEPYITKPFALLLGDIYFEMDRKIDPFHLIRDRGADALLSVMEEPNTDAIRRNFTVHVNDDGVVQRVIEKPRVPQTTLKGCGLYIFNVTFFDAVRRTPRSAGRDEFEITHAVQIYIDDGAKVIASAMVYDDINLTYPFDVLLANLHALRAEGGGNLISPDANIDPDAAIEQCVIGSGARISAGTSLRQSVVMPNAKVTSTELIDRAVITLDQLVDCKHWVDREGRAIDRSDESYKPF